MKTYVYFPTGRLIWRILPDELRRKQGLEPAIWIGDDRHLGHARANYPNAISYSLNRTLSGDLWPGTHSRGAPHVSVEPFRSGLEAIQVQALSMMNRLELLEGMDYLEREFRFWNTASHFLHVLDHLEPDALVAAEAPHSYPQFIIHELCRMKQIPTLHFCSSNIAPFLVPRFGIGAETETLPAGIERGDLSFLHSRIETYFEKFAEHDYASIEPAYMQIQRASGEGDQSSRWNPESVCDGAPRSRAIHHATSIARDSRRRVTGTLQPVAEKISRASREPRTVIPAVGRRVARRKLRRKRIDDIERLRNSYQMAVASSQEASPFVYFPMHYEPERTTNPEGGRYWNQYKALSTLRAVLPDNISLGVREHPSQFNPRMRGHLGRSKGFYSWVASLRNTFLIPTDADPLPLLTESEFVATVTGTAALEAVAFGRPAVVLGHPWFEGVPGSMGLDHVCSGKAGGALHRTPDVKAFVHRLVEQSGVPGVINPSNERLYQGMPGMESIFDDALSARTLASTIVALLRNQGG